MFALKVNAEVKGQMSDGLQGEQHLLVELGEGLYLGGQGEEPEGKVVLAQCVCGKTRECGHKNSYLRNVSVGKQGGVVTRIVTCAMCLWENKGVWSQE